MKKILIASILLVPIIVNASDKDLDYCATVDSWVAQKTIAEITLQDKTLDPQRASSFLLLRTPVKDKSTPVVMGDWGQLYTQTIKVILPFKNAKKGRKTIIATSIISAKECSLGDPSFIDLSMAETQGG